MDFFSISYQSNPLPGDLFVEWLFRRACTPQDLILIGNPSTTLDKSIRLVQKGRFALIGFESRTQGVYNPLGFIENDGLDAPTHPCFVEGGTRGRRPHQLRQTMQPRIIGTSCSSSWCCGWGIRTRHITVLLQAVRLLAFSRLSCAWMIEVENKDLR